jgi:hypothetical protein
LLNQLAAGAIEANQRAAVVDKPRQIFVSLISNSAAFGRGNVAINPRPCLLGGQDNRVKTCP